MGGKCCRAFSPTLAAVFCRVGCCKRARWGWPSKTTT